MIESHETVQDPEKAELDTDVAEESPQSTEASPLERTPEEEFLARMLAATGATSLEEAGLRDPEREAELANRLEEELSPEERQAKAEHDAFAAAFDMIRTRSNTGKLTTPGTWAAEGIVPVHLTPVEFSDLVFDEIIAAQAAMREEASSAGAADESIETGDRQEGTRASEDDRTAETSDTLIDDGENADINDNRGTSESETPAWQLDDIKVLEGAQTYLYSSDFMTDAYAHWAFLAEEGDDALTLADNARAESRMYPRPMLATSLSSKPYRWNAERIAQAWQAVQESDAYSDIRTCTASNGERYFYSSDHLSDAQAKALAEWYSVERYMNV